VQRHAPLPAAFSALADPTRQADITHLARGEASVNDLVGRFPISQPAISRHLKVLETPRLIERHIEGKRRPCRLNPAALTPVRRWISDPRTALSSQLFAS